MNANSIYSPYDFKTTEEREGGKFRGTIVFTGIDEGIRGTDKTLGGEMGSYVRSYSCPDYNGVHIWLPGSEKKRDHDPITITDEPTFRRVVSALNAVRDKLIAEHETKKEETKVESITVDGWTVRLLKPITLAGIIKCGNVGCGEFREEFEAFECSVYDADGDTLGPFDPMPIDNDNIKAVLAHPKWKDFLVQHGFIEVKKAEPVRRSDMEEFTVIDGIRHEKVYDFKATSFTENGKWVKGEVQFTWMNEKYRGQGKADGWVEEVNIGEHNGRFIKSVGCPDNMMATLFIPGRCKDDDGNVLRYANKNDFDRDVAALAACQYKPVVEDEPKVLDATLKAIDAYVVEREKEVKRINGVIEQLVGLMEKRPQDICDQFMKVKGRDFYETVVGFPHEASTCPYCIDGHSGGLYCRNDSCGYAKAHGGICDADERSDWHKMRSARKTLLCAIEKAYPFEDKG